MISVTQLISNFGVGPGCKEPSFFGLKTWYHYLDTDANCNVINFKPLPSSGRSDFLLIALAIVDDMLRIAGLVAIGFVIYGGVLYMTSQGSPDQTKKAYGTIINALVGLVFCILSIALVAYIGNKVG
jgi:hypothetical protein